MPHVFHFTSFPQFIQLLPMRLHAFIAAILRVPSGVSTKDVVMSLGIKSQAKILKKLLILVVYRLYIIVESFMLCINQISSACIMEPLIPKQLNLTLSVRITKVRSRLALQPINIRFLKFYNLKFYNISSIIVQQLIIIIILILILIMSIMKPKFAHTANVLLCHVSLSVSN